MFCRVIYVYRQNDRKTKNDRIYTINKDFNAPQIRNRVSSTTIYTTANNTVSNEQQDGRGISVITPLPMGEGTGEGPLYCWGGPTCLSWKPHLHHNKFSIYSHPIPVLFPPFSYFCPQRTLGRLVKTIENLPPNKRLYTF